MDNVFRSFASSIGDTLDDLNIERRRNKKIIKKIEYANNEIEETKAKLQESKITKETWVLYLTNKIDLIITT